MTNTTFIYGLLDPRTKELRYIGKADDPNTRLAKHTKYSQKETNYKAR